MNLRRFVFWFWTVASPVAWGQSPMTGPAPAPPPAPSPGTSTGGTTGSGGSTTGTGGTTTGGGTTSVSVGGCMPGTSGTSALSQYLSTISADPASTTHDVGSTIVVTLCTEAGAPVVGVEVSLAGSNSSGDVISVVSNDADSDGMPETDSQGQVTFFVSSGIPNASSTFTATASQSSVTVTLSTTVLFTSLMIGSCAADDPTCIDPNVIGALPPAPPANPLPAEECESSCTTHLACNVTQTQCQTDIQACKASCVAAPLCAPTDFLCQAQNPQLRVGTLAVGLSFSLMVTTDNRLWSWGANSRGQLASRNRDARSSAGPVRLENGDPLEQVTRVAAAELAAVAISGSNGTVYSWGAAEYGLLGDGQLPDPDLGTSRLFAAPVLKVDGTPLSAAEDVACGAEFCMALLAGGQVWTWGRNNNGQLGLGDRVDRPRAVRVQGGLPAARAIVATRANASIITQANGSVWSWGAIAQNGDGSRAERRSPVRSGYDSFIDVLMLAGTSSRTYALVSQETSAATPTTPAVRRSFLWGWGFGNIPTLPGWIGLRTRPLRARIPFEPPAGANGPFPEFSYFEGDAISANSIHVYMRRNGTLYAWGPNSWGGVGDGTTEGRDLPVPVRTAANAVFNMGNGTLAVGPNAGHMLATDGQGLLYGWGTNSVGELGTAPVEGQPATQQRLFATRITFGAN